MQNINKILRFAILLGVILSNNSYAANNNKYYNAYDELSFGYTNNIENTNNTLQYTNPEMNHDKNVKLEENINILQNQSTTQHTTNTFQNKQNIDDFRKIINVIKEKTKEESLKLNDNTQKIKDLFSNTKNYQKNILETLDHYNKDLFEISKKIGTSESNQNKIQISINNLITRNNHKKFIELRDNEIITDRTSNDILSDENANITHDIQHYNNINLKVKYNNYKNSVSGTINNVLKTDNKQELKNVNRNINNLCYDKFFNIKDYFNNKIKSINETQNAIDYKIDNLNSFMNILNNNTNTQLKTTADQNASLKHLRTKTIELLDANNISKRRLKQKIPQFNINNHIGVIQFNDNEEDVNNNINIDNSNKQNKIKLFNNNYINDSNIDTPSKNTLVNITDKLINFESNNEALSNKCNDLNTLTNNIKNTTNNNLNLLFNNIQKINSKINNTINFNDKHSNSLKKLQATMCTLENKNDIHYTITHKYKQEKNKNSELTINNIRLKKSVNELTHKCRILEKKNNNTKSSSSNNGRNNRERSRSREILNDKIKTNFANNNLHNQQNKDNEKMDIEKINNDHSNITININNREKDIKEMNSNAKSNKFGQRSCTNNFGEQRESNKFGEQREPNNQTSSDHAVIQNNNINQNSIFTPTTIQANSNRHVINYPKFGPKPEKVILDSDDEIK